MADPKDTSSGSSLLKYDPPQLVTLGGAAAKAPKQASLLLRNRKAPLPATEEVLHAILPPRQWERDGKLWMQYASSTPATRIDIEHLKEQLDLKMQQRGARETGICPVREELFAQCFDELIREVTVTCAERGLLLLRIRNEAMQNIKCYQTLYESAIAFGMRVAITSEQTTAEAEAQAAMLALDVKELEEQVARQQQRLRDMAAAEAKRAEADEERHREEVDRLQAAVAHLKNSLEAQLAPPAQRQ